ncbi:hypothetical protein F5884DRAFT_274080 [Xylogone sp. PMI_703]|nr:hypothetical protein F5884DRAFT_274080 [Xylogone sp. PMI_703]
MRKSPTRRRAPGPSNHPRSSRSSLSSSSYPSSTSTTTSSPSSSSSSSSSTSSTSLASTRDAPIDEANLYKGVRVSKRNPINLLHIVSFVFLILVLAVQFFFAENHRPSYTYSRHHLPYTKTSYSPPARANDQDTCESPHPFPTEAPVSRPHKMALLAEAKRIAAEFEYSDEDVQKGVIEFIREMNEGLQINDTQLSQIPTYVTGIPDGTEKGLYLAVDLGGTNFRVCSIELNGDTTFSLTQSKVPIPRSLMQAKSAKDLFAFLAKQIELFLKTHHEDHFEAHIRRRQTFGTPEGFRDIHTFNLGFTFSFPVHQVGINRGTLIRWTKGFDIPDAIGQDVCALLQKEIDILKLPVRVAALVNDTVGTLMARAYTSPGKTKTLLGAIFGTGTNGAYVEKLKAVTKPLEGDYNKSATEMVVNTEWGSFDNKLKVLPNTIYDQILDKDSVNPGIQMFEKRISGMFLGEILRIVLLQMIKDPNIPLFSDKDSSHNDIRSTTTIAENSPLYTQWAVDSSILSIAEADHTVGLRALRLEIEKTLGVSAPSIEDAQAVKDIAHAIAKRAARLSGVAIAGIVLHTGRLKPLKSDKFDEDDMVDIGVDGSLVEFYPGFEDYMRDAIRITDGIGEIGEKRIRIGIAKDGSGVGAALIALVAAKMESGNDYLGDVRMKLHNIAEELKAQGNDDSD